ncbi:hypothetical protein, partial [Thiobacter aerophilum]
MRWICQGFFVIAFIIPLHALAGGTRLPESIHSPPPDQRLIEKFTGKAKTLYYADPQIKQRVLVSDRILDGFGYGPLRLTLDNGTAIYWGARHGEATTESVAIFDKAGRPRLLAAVDSIPWCDGTGSHCAPFTSVEAFEARARRTFLYPGIALFVRDKRDLETYLPYFKRWLHANILGFNVDCSDPKMADACRFVTQTEWLEIIPTRAYLLPSMR